MIVIAIVVCCIGLFVILCKQLEDQVNKVVGHQRKTHERISHIEEHEQHQDAALTRQKDAIVGLRKDVNELGRDVGWHDDNRRTQVMKQKDRDPDDIA